MVNSAIVILPTYRHVITLPFAIESAQNQTIQDIEIAIIGDGVNDDTRDIVSDFKKKDSRIRFYDEPKCRSRNELVRNQVISKSNAKIVTYLGDDDLFFPNHVEIMSNILKKNDFAHPLPILFFKKDKISKFKTDLKDPKWVKYHLERGQNTIALTGVSHTLKFYKSLPVGWEIPPEGEWSDHYMWQKMFKMRNVKLETSEYSTTLKMMATPREKNSNADILEEVKYWSDCIKDNKFFKYWQNKVNHTEPKDVESPIRFEIEI